MKTVTITVGVPAFNEQDNIQNLIKTILKQKQFGFKITKIIVASDGSTDRTVDKVKEIKSSLIKIMNNKTRRGVASMENQIIENTDSDILVIVNADISISDPYFLKLLTEPLIRNKTDLVTANFLPLKPFSLTGKLLYVSALYKHLVFDDYKNGDNWFTCCGRARAFSKKLYTRIYFKQSAGEDLYSYLYAKYYGFTYKFIKKATVWYRLPEVMNDHERQSLRFYNSIKLLNREFGNNFVRNNIDWPTGRLIYMGLFSLVKHPIMMSAYLLINGYVFIKSKLLPKRDTKDKWITSPSTKLLTH